MHSILEKNGIRFLFWGYIILSLLTVAGRLFDLAFLEPFSYLPCVRYPLLGIDLFIAAVVFEENAVAACVVGILYILLIAFFVCAVVSGCKKHYWPFLWFVLIDLLVLVGLLILKLLLGNPTGWLSFLLWILINGVYAVVFYWRLYAETNNQRAEPNV